MSKVMGLLGVLVLSASAFGAPVLTIDNVTWDDVGGQLYFDLVLVDNDGLGTATAGCGLGVTLVGDVSSLTSTPVEMRYTGSGGATLVAPDTYLWEGIAAAANASGASPDSLNSFSVIGDMLETVPPDEGDIVARYIFGWDGTVPAVYSIDVQVTGDAGMPEPYFLDGTMFTPVNASVDNNNLSIPVPEPATMGLLGVGLAALALRRRK